MTTESNSSFLKVFTGWTNEQLAFLLLRLWLAMRALLTGLEKFSGTATREVVTINEFTELEETTTIAYKAYGVSHYKAIPDVLKEQFTGQPLLPEFMTGPYYAILGYLLVLLGITLFLGICLRTSLFVMGLLYISLTYGLILIKQDGGIAWLGIHLLLIVGALLLEKHKRLVIFPRN